LVSENTRRLDPTAHRGPLTLYNGHPLQTVDTSAGLAEFGVPYAKLNQNVAVMKKFCPKSVSGTPLHA
jgi:hypothetical protein